MGSVEEEFVSVTHKLQEAYLAAQKAKDGLLVYLIERALFQAEKMAAVSLSPPNSNLEQSKLPPVFW
jgi:hypothetical protein